MGLNDAQLLARLKEVACYRCGNESDFTYSDYKQTVECSFCGIDLDMGEAHLYWCRLVAAKAQPDTTGSLLRSVRSIHNRLGEQEIKLDKIISQGTMQNSNLIDARWELAKNLLGKVDNQALQLSNALLEIDALHKKIDTLVVELAGVPDDSEEVSDDNIFTEREGFEDR